ncbi:hypothetical protein DSO57_1022796 [Entomophthora muscae]|uniref:Uncharacterized protein n=1 Tax=Entomophthora muscae TaxID=34485 RepID=A0ACC2TEK5_9FUNG|nr:hypothetical protein DSO57_1022796 [Entomophthora muscae]
MMAEQNYDIEKHALSSSATPQPMNKKSTLEYIIEPNSPCFPFTLLPKQRATRSRGPFPGPELTPPPLKRTDRENTPSPSNFPLLSKLRRHPLHCTKLRTTLWHQSAMTHSWYPLYTVTPSDPSSWQPMESSPPKFLC